jgi:hypothetical protein
MRFAVTFSGRLAKAAGAALLHAFVPALCETTASQAIIDMHGEIAARRAQMAQRASARANPAEVADFRDKDLLQHS